MEYLRYVMLFLIIFFSTSVGFLLSKKYLDRVREIRIFLSLINILQNKIKFSQKPLAEILEETSKINENEKISEIFLKTSRNLKNERSDEAWKNAVEEEKFFLNLTDEDINIIETLGYTLGKTNIEGQMSEINQFTILIKKQQEQAEEERAKNEKMYKSLGTIVGLVIAILVF